MRSIRIAAWLVVVALVAFSACSDSDDSAVPNCAGELPVPDGVEVVDTTEGDTCTMTLAADESFSKVRSSWRRTLDEDGWEYSVQRRTPRSTFLQLTSPECGLVMVFAPGSPRVAASVPSDRTPTLVSMLPCSVDVGPPRR